MGIHTKLTYLRLQKTSFFKMSMTLQFTYISKAD